MLVHLWGFCCILARICKVFLILTAESFLSRQAIIAVCMEMFRYGLFTFLSSSIINFSQFLHKCIVSFLGGQ